MTTGMCAHPGNDPDCMGDEDGCAIRTCGWVPEVVEDEDEAEDEEDGDVDGSVTHATGAGSAEDATPPRMAHPDDDVARVAALAEAGAGACAWHDAGQILDIIARNLRRIETEMRQPG